MKLSKSLEELDALADELLAKSQAPADDKEELKADEISESVDNPENDAEETEEDEAEEKEEAKEEIEKCNSIKKSEDADEPKADDIVEKSEDEMDLEKSEEPADEESEEKEVEEPEESETEEEEEPTSEDIEKSMMSNFEDDDTIAKSMANNEFVSALVEVISKSLADVQYDILAKSNAQSQGNDILAKSLQATMTLNQKLHEENEAMATKIESLEKSMAEKIEELTNTLNEVSKQPAQMRKSVADIQTMDRNFDASIGSTPNKTNTFESLSKSQVLQTLETELYSGNPNVTPSDIISYESGAPLRPELQSMVTNKLK